MQKQWQVKPRTEPTIIEQLMKDRNIISPEERELFLHPDYTRALDPFLFEDMDKAVLRLWQALEDHEKIVIYSDYDADAITANAVVYRALKLLGADVSVYIPDRFSEGYGLNLEAFEKIRDNGVTVVITVDCGTNSTAEADFCNANGIDLIITDHHEITGEIPQSYALINPKRPGESFPYHELTGVGVAFKLVAALFATKEHATLPEAQNLPEGFEKWFLDLVAIGTVADCHSLLGENRILVGFGLKVLQKSKWPGVRAMLELANIKFDEKPAEAYTLGFVLAPRINAAGRIDHASVAFDLLVTDDPEEAIRLAKNLEMLNSKRQLLTETVISEAREQITHIKDNKLLLVSGTDWPKGVVGLVAGKLTEEYGKPVLVLERGTEFATGSARSIPSFNVVDALIANKELLVKFGGHAAAAGFTLRTEHLDPFYQGLLAFADSTINEQDLVKVLNLESQIIPEEITIQTVESLSRFEPFGVDNQKPKFALLNVDLKDFQAVGKDKKHLQMSVSARTAEGMKTFKCIGFNFGQMAMTLSQGEKLDLACELLLDSWNGTKTVKLRIIDLKRMEQIYG